MKVPQTEMAEAESLLRFMEGMKMAAGAAGQMAHHQQNPRWLKVRLAIEACLHTAMQMAASRPLSRSEVLAQLDRHKLPSA